MFEIPSVRNGQLGFGLVYSVWVKMYVYLRSLIFESNYVLILSLSYRFGGHSDGVTPGLVSIPEVKSFRVLFVYYGFRSMGISFSCQPFFIQE